jgi:regulator of nucleoside diphosphate kinase
MNTMLDYKLNPEIVVSEADHRQLLVLAMAGTGHSADAADDLLYEMERARIVADAALPEDVVRMGSTATIRSDNGADRTVTLVYPVDADISEGRISVLTPIGTALIGLSRGQSITFQSRDGRNHVLTVLSVTAPAAA